MLDAFAWTGKDAPTLIMRREDPADFRTPNRQPVDRTFFALLPHKDRQFVFLPGQAHVGRLGTNRHLFFQVIRAFLTMPPRQDGETGKKKR